MNDDNVLEIIKEAIEKRHNSYALLVERLEGGQGVHWYAEWTTHTGPKRDGLKSLEDVRDLAYRSMKEYFNTPPFPTPAGALTDDEIEDLGG